MIEDDLERIIGKHKTEERNPEIAKQEFILGETELKKENYAKAAKHFNVAYNNDPNKEYLRKKIYSFYIEYTEPLEKRKELKKEVNVDEAIKELEIAIGLDSEYDVYHSLLAIFLGLNGRATEAVEETRKAIRLEPDSALNHNNLAFYLGKVGKSEEGVIEYEKAIELDPDNFLYHFNLAITLSAKREDQRALAEFKSAIRLNPNHAESYASLGLHLEMMGLDPENEYREAVRLSPKNKINGLSLILLLQKKGKLDEAIEKCKKIVSIDPDDSFYHGVLAWLLYKNDKKEESIEEYRETVRLVSDDKFYRVDLARILKEVGRREEAEEEYRIAIDLDPSNKDAKRDLSLIISEKGMEEYNKWRIEDNSNANAYLFTKAKDRFEEAITMNESNILAHYYLGDILSIADRPSEAIHHYNKVIKLNFEEELSKVDQVTLYFHLGLAFYNDDDTEKGISYLKEALENAKDLTECDADKNTRKKINNIMRNTLSYMRMSTSSIGRMMQKKGFGDMGAKFNAELSEIDYIRPTDIRRTF